MLWCDPRVAEVRAGIQAQHVRRAVRYGLGRRFVDDGQQGNAVVAVDGALPGAVQLPGSLPLFSRLR
jgi:hypothetical protein